MSVQGFIHKNVFYLKYVLKHKWFVFLEACKLGIPWRGVVHDLSKFSQREWEPRVAFLARKNQGSEYTAEFYDPNKVEDTVVLSWLYHYHQNPHHWQWWIVILDNGKTKILPMTDEYRREMLADWRAVSRMPDRMDMLPWYHENKKNMILHPDTRAWIEQQIYQTL